MTDPLPDVNQIGPISSTETFPETAASVSHVGEGSPLLQPLTAALLECVTPAEVVQVVVERGLAVLGARAGLVALITRDGQELEIVRTSGYGPDALSNWGRFPLEGPYPLSDVVRGGGTLYMRNRFDWTARYPALTGTIKETFQASVSLPLAARQRVFGAMHFSFTELREFHDSDRAFLEELSRQCALALERALLLEEVQEARASAEVAQARQGFLARASALLAESLDYQTTLHAVACLAVPDLCDWAAVDMVDAANEKLTLLNLAVAHADPDEAAWVREAALRYPTDMTQVAHPVVQAISKGQTVFLPEIPEEVLLAAARDGEHLGLIRKMDLRSFLCVPLTARGRTLGAVTFASTRASGRIFTPEVVALVEELAQRAAIAVDNARVLAEMEQANARQRDWLQRSEERFRLLVEGVRDYAIFMLDPEGRVTTWNAGAEHFKGYRADEVIGQHFSRFYTEDDIARRHPWNELEIATREGRYEEEGWRVRKDGSRFFANVVITALRNKEGELRGFAKVTRDVTERRLSEQERVATEALKQQRRFLKDVLASVTQGRLLLCNEPDDLPVPLSIDTSGDPIPLSKEALKAVRVRVSTAALTYGLSLERTQDLMTAASECAMNAVQHAGGGTVRVYGNSSAVQVWIKDVGKGIELSNLPRVTLEPGFGTGGGGIGHGFSLMILCCDRVFLLTGPSGTTVVLEQERTPPEPAWLK